MFNCVPKNIICIPHISCFSSLFQPPTCRFQKHPCNYSPLMSLRLCHHDHDLHAKCCNCGYVIVMSNPYGLMPANSSLSALHRNWSNIMWMALAYESFFCGQEEVIRGQVSIYRYRITKFKLGQLRQIFRNAILYKYAPGGPTLLRPLLLPLLLPPPPTGHII